MARKSKSRKSRKRRVLPNLGELDWSQARPVLNALAWTAAAIALTAGWMIGVPRLRAEVTIAARSDEIVITFEELPPWVNGDLLARLEITARSHLTGDPFQQEELSAIRDALLATGWFESIGQVRRIRAEEVLIDAEFLMPFALVRDADGDHLIDPYGRLMPRMYATGTGPPQKVVIEGAHFDRPSRTGTQWEGTDITAALRLLRLIDDRSWRDQLTSVDVRRYLPDQVLSLKTNRGAEIIWGSAPGEEQALEVLAERKLAYLDKAHEEFDRVDMGYAGEWYFLQEGFIAK